MQLLGHSIARTTVTRILKEQGIEPAPERRKHEPWAKFLKSHWGAIAATDFFDVEVMTWHGPVRYSVLFVMDLKTRVVHVAGVALDPGEGWMMQVARNLTDCVDGFLLPMRHLILDRDPRFTAAFRRLVRDSGVEPVRLPRRSPNLNAYAERFVRLSHYDREAA